MKFDYRGYVVELSVPSSYPVNDNPEVVQAKERSAAGIPHVESFGLNLERRTYMLIDLPDSDYKLLRDFFTDQVKGAENEFILTDDAGNVSTVSFLVNSLSFQNVDFNAWTGTFTVEGIF